jgi:glycosyltransferase involved in cell wall biosynthesis
MKVLVVAANASERMGGEAILPLRYFMGLRRRGADVLLLTHARCREELRRTLASEEGRIFYIEDHPLEICVYKVGLLFPHPLREVLFLPLVHAITEYRLGRAARKLIVARDVDVVHQPLPVSPRAPSFLYNQPAAVVVGPMNGNMDYPPAFRRRYARGTRIVTSVSRIFSGVLNCFFPGKAEAACLLAANERTARSLRRMLPRAKIEFLVENAVDLNAWARSIPAPTKGMPKFLFVGRLVHWKAVDMLIDAFRHVGEPAELIIIGDGPDRLNLEEQARHVEMAQKKIRFLGFLDHSGIRREMAQAVALALPSLRESGGAVVLEAMASSLPVIAIKWGGPEDYVTSETGYLVEPLDREYVIKRIAQHIEYLARNPRVAREMGERGRESIERGFAWDASIQQVVEIYHEAMDRHSRKRSAPAGVSL